MKFNILLHSDGPRCSFYNKERKNISISKENLNIFLNIIKIFNIPTNFLYNNNIFNNNIIPKNLNIESDTTIIHDYNIDNYTSYIENAIVFINDEKKLFDTIMKLKEIVFGYIDIKFKSLNNYNLEILHEKLKHIIQFLYISHSYKTDTPTFIIKQLNDFSFNNRYGDFGVNSIFIDPELNVYFHPDFYYNNEDPISHLLDFDFLNKEIFHETKPHLICENCESFYCERNIYNNKKFTSEYKVPATIECEKTTLLSNYSKQLYNMIYNKNLNVNKNLDVVNSFDAETEFKKLKNNFRGQIIKNNG